MHKAKDKNAFTTTTSTNTHKLKSTLDNNEAEEAVNIKVYILKII
jgi:hypothetical protein